MWRGGAALAIAGGCAALQLRFAAHLPFVRAFA
jgi:hypothetical protein